MQDCAARRPRAPTVEVKVKAEIESVEFITEASSEDEAKTRPKTRQVGNPIRARIATITFRDPSPG